MNHVLIVDDEADIRESLEAILHEEDYVITTAGTAAEAMQQSLLRELRIATALLPSGMVELTISDTGSGLTDEMRERLFLPYFSTKQRGTGLGLSIAAKILQEHHGSIRAERNIPTGARFILELRPANEPADNPPAPTTETATQPEQELA